MEVLGYVSTGWGSRPVTQVLQDIAAYRTWYGLHSIFLDEAASSAGSLAYYQALAEVVRGVSGALVALNPGTVPDEAYATLADLLVLFEGSYDQYRSWAPPAWQEYYPRERFWHLVYATPRRRADAALRTADRRSAGVVYVTDDVLDNPWDRLPSYWTQALRTVSLLNR